MTIALVVVTLSGACIKLPKGASGGLTPPPTESQYIYPFGGEPQTVTAELTLTFSEDVDLSTIKVEIPPLKFNKSLLVLLSQDDCKQAAFSTTWAAINGRMLSNTYYYTAGQMRGGDLPPDGYSLGKTLGSTDGTGREVRFSFTTALLPEWAYMDEKGIVKPGFSANFYRFFMKAGLDWECVNELVNYGVGIAFHDLKTEAINNQDSLLKHYHIAQTRIQDRLGGRGCKMLSEPNGNKSYVVAAEKYAPIRTVVLQTGDGLILKPFDTKGDLSGKKLQREFSAPQNLPTEIENQLQLPAEERQAINIGVHGTDKSWVEFLLWLNDHHGKDGDDCVWMPSIEEYYEYNYLRNHATFTQRVEGRSIHLTIEMPGELYFYYPSLTLNFPGLTRSQCVSVDANDRVSGLSWGAYEDGVMVNIDCRHALIAHAEHYVALYEASPSPANKADAHYFVSMLRESTQKERLLKRVK